MRLVVFKRFIMPWLLASLWLAPSVWAATATPDKAAGGQKFALVIGNDTYRAVGMLEKAANDARSMGGALQRAGFSTTIVVNATRAQMNSAINRFVQDVSAGGVGVFFYAGHGVQVANENFLIPIDLQTIESEADIADQSVSLQSVQNKLADARARFTLLVIDACRDNPLPRKPGRALGGTRGLAQISSAEGQIVVFSAGANQQALDKMSATDMNPNGLFTREFLPWLDKRDVTIREAVLGVRSSVRAAARTVNHDQFPAIYDQAEGDFFFWPQKPPAPAMAAKEAPAADKQANTDAKDMALWKVVDASNQLEDYRAYLEQFPNGIYAALARSRVKRLTPVQMAVTTPAPTPAPAAEAAKPKPAQPAATAPAAPVVVQTALAQPQAKPTVATTNAVGGVIKDCDICPELVRVPAGKFTMGSATGTGGFFSKPNNMPQREVQIAQPFLMGRTVVTQAQWQALMGSNPTRLADRGDDLPVSQVSWDDAQAYVRALSAKTGRSYRLPTEAQWEYACHAGSYEKYCGGDDVGALGWYRANSVEQVYKRSSEGKMLVDEPRLRPVATKRANAFGLHDMSGDVAQWVEDVYHESFNGAPSDGSAWIAGADAENRVLRGGSWLDQETKLQATYRSKNSADDRDVGIGFRVVRSAP